MEEQILEDIQQEELDIEALELNPNHWSAL